MLIHFLKVPSLAMHLRKSFANFKVRPREQNLARGHGKIDIWGKFRNRENPIQNEVGGRLATSQKLIYHNMTCRDCFLLGK